MHDMVDAASSFPVRCHCLAMSARLVPFLSSHFISSSSDVSAGGTGGGDGSEVVGGPWSAPRLGRPQ